MKKSRMTKSEKAFYQIILAEIKSGDRHLVPVDELIAWTDLHLNKTY
jgi:hypothetical protein